MQPAVVPKAPVEELPWKRLVMVCSVAFFLPLGLAVAWEHLVRRVSDRSQLERVAHLPVVGEIAALPARRLRGSLSASSLRGRLYRESVDSLRTSINLSESLSEVRIIAICSAVSREGKTSVSSQLAVSIAQSTGQPTLLIDGDMRSPDVHRVFGIPVGPGLAETLRGECSVDDAINQTWSSNLHLMPAGLLDSSPHILLSKGSLNTILEQLRGRYANIVLDTPPILPASEALVIARLADAAVLCTMRDVSRIDQVADAYRRLRSSGVTVAGAVLNGVPVGSYVYRYGSYQDVPRPTQRGTIRSPEPDQDASA